MDPAIALTWFERNGLATLELIAAGWFLANKVWPWLKEYAAQKLKFEQERSQRQDGQLEKWSAVVQASTDASRAMTAAMEILARDVRQEMGELRRDIAQLKSDFGK